MKTVFNRILSLVLSLGIGTAVTAADLKMEYKFDNGADRQWDNIDSVTNSWGIFLDHQPGDGWDWTEPGILPSNDAPAAWKLPGTVGVWGGIYYYAATGESLPSQFTYTLWVKPEEKTDGNNWCGLISNTYEGDAQNGYQLTLNTPDDPANPDDGVLFFNTGNGTEGANIKLTSAPGVVTKGEWQLIALVVDGVALTAKVYVNGVEVISGAILGAFNRKEYVFCGNIGPNYPYKGLIDDIRVYYGCLTQEQIVALTEEVLDETPVTSAQGVWSIYQ